jgi:hypothetical protein
MTADLDAQAPRRASPWSGLGGGRLTRPTGFSTPPRSTAPARYRSTVPAASARRTLEARWKRREREAQATREDQRAHVEFGAIDAFSDGLHGIVLPEVAARFDRPAQLPCFAKGLDSHEHKKRTSGCESNGTFVR